METERRAVRLPGGRGHGIFSAGAPGGGPPGGPRGAPDEPAPPRRGGGARQAPGPGYEESTPRPGRTVADVVPDVAAVLDAIGADRYVSIGFSGGGPHTPACAALAPGRCPG